MSHQSQSLSDDQGPANDPKTSFRVILVDRDAHLASMLTEAIDSVPCQVDQFDTLAEARECIAAGSVDLALIEPDLPDGCGLVLAEELHRSSTQTIMVCSDPSLHRAIQAIRVGAIDFIVKPVIAAELRDRVRQAMRRHRLNRRKTQRVRRLRRTCKKLSKMRNEVVQQVDVLCRDLVTAYHELAQQMTHVVQATEFSSLMHRELDLEQLLRKTLEYLLSKAGPTNAAIFIPAGKKRFTLAGFVNYDRASDTADMLLEHLADVLAPQIAQYDTPIHITDNEALNKWFGDDSAYLLDNHAIAISCCNDGEALGVVVLFRDMSEPYDDSAIETVAAIAPMLADFLAKAIRIHHRHLDSSDDHWDIAV